MDHGYFGPQSCFEIRIFSNTEQSKILCFQGNAKLCVCLKDFVFKRMIAEGGKSPSSTQSDKTKSVYFTSCSPNRRNNTTSLETVKSLYSSVCLTPFGLVPTLPALHNCLQRNKSLKNTIMARLYASFSNTLKKIKN